MRHRQGQGAAGQRHAVGLQPAAELDQEPVRAGRGAGLVDQPGERRGQIHRRDHAATAVSCHVTARAAISLERSLRSMLVRPRMGSGPGSRPAATVGQRSR